MGRCRAWITIICIVLFNAPCFHQHDYTHHFDGFSFICATIKADRLIIPDSNRLYVSPIQKRYFMLKHSWIPSTSSSFSVQSTDWSSTYVLYSVVCFDNIMTSHCKWCYNLWAIIANKQPKKMPVLLLFSLSCTTIRLCHELTVFRNRARWTKENTRTQSHIRSEWNATEKQYHRNISNNANIIRFFSALLSKILVEVLMSLGPKNQCSVLLNI